LLPIPRSAKSAPPASGGGGGGTRNALLSSICQGAKLRKVTPPDDSPKVGGVVRDGWVGLNGEFGCFMADLGDLKGDLWVRRVFLYIMEVLFWSI
jgi:hypothetical protein